MTLYHPRPERWPQVSPKGLLLLVTLIASCSSADEPIRLVDAHLRQTFPSDGRDIAYFPGVSAPTLVEAPILRRVIPRTSFYRTKLKTGQYEYPEVEALIATTHTGTATTYTHCLSPTYSDQSPEFLSVFTPIRATSVADREQVARAIAELFAAITYAGRVGVIRKHASTIEVELWHGELMWRHVTVSFTATNNIESVKLVNPKSG